MIYLARFFFFALMFSTGCAFADIKKSISVVKPSVLIVGTYNASNSPRFNLRGTGFAVSDGVAATTNVLITNAHVLLRTIEESAGTFLVIQVNLGKAGWQLRSATVLDIDQTHDLALLKFDGLPVHALQVSDSSNIMEGQSIAFMGFPIGGSLGFTPVTHRGLISAITSVAMPTPSASILNSKVIRSLRDGGSFEIFQLDGIAYPGNSGGPMFDPDTGDVLGVLNMVFVKGTRESALTNPSGISYAIPSIHIINLIKKNISLFSAN